MRNGKKLFALLLALAMVLSLAACGDSASGAAPEASVPEQSEAPTQPTAEAPAVPEADSAEEMSAAEPAAARPEISYPLFDEVTTFSLWTSNSPDLSEIISSLDEYLVFEQLEKVTNVRWDCTPVSFFSAQEQFQLMVASQDYTDVVCRALDEMTGYSGGADKAIEEEFLIDVGGLVEENMPNLQGWFEE